MSVRLRGGSLTVRHIVTGEFPPHTGGVAGYTATVAHALAAAGEEIHVWCPGEATLPEQTAERVFAHRVLGDLGAGDLARADVALAAFPGSKRMLVQWVPHAYGHASLNVGFCRWMRRRARREQDQVEIVVHEPFLPFAGGVRQHAAALIHRWMLSTILSAASRAYVPTDRWKALCRPYARRLSFRWMPVPSGIPPTALADAPAACRTALSLPSGGIVIGTFGGGGPAQIHELAALAAALHHARISAALLLIGAGSVEKRDAIGAAVPAARGMVRATGPLSPVDVSRALRACDLCVQTYADGVSGRRSSAMAVLAHGVPLLTNEGIATEPVWKESAGLVPGDRSCVPAVLELVHDVARRARLSRDGLALYDSRFDVRHTVAVLQGAA